MKWFSLLLFSLTTYAVEPITLPLWPEGAPGKMAEPSQGTLESLAKHASKSFVTNVSEPTMTVYRPDKPNGTSVIVAPGGAFIFLSAVHEGSQVCEWLNTLGVTAILLTYRTPTRDESAPHEKPVQDAQKALSLVRQHAKEWHLNPKRVGLMGFSAGGNLLAHLACDRDLKNDPQSDDADLQVQRPDFGIMIYGGGFLDPTDPLKLSVDFKVPGDAPPLFMACAGDDGNNPIAATLIYLEYKKLKIPAELHLFSEGGHGFGMRANGQPINQWPARCAEWMDSNGWLPTAAKLDAAIQHHEDALQILVKSVTKLTCGNDAQMIAASLQELEAKFARAVILNQDEKDRLEKKLQKSREAAKKKIQELSPNTIKPETLVQEINQLKQNIAELQAEREWLTQ
ncbi:MAG: alpha/beta hydrolase fold domain-containing protein [Prosthecobacter sp.]|nr:alpha/beta hydrolase fold domain-containing protein [Prosthecobacter sp.]